ncbi:hypothetical protein FOE78_23135 [Microlunatus elymi]|uniref:Uncharacterized protein n=1 Tax=Microlunatus elymi TaxID=2596828 RepID=A0A516Q4W6_9ACTN|nr:hypothetical protein [Microlunatus elymi]QDP98412.1 hypothetical protein FOE78_23135 [Microlunatus elymi]
MSTRRRFPLSVRAMLAVIALALIFALLRVISTLGEPPSSSAIYTSKLVVVGVTGRYQPDATDDKIISEHAGDVQTGAMSIRARNQGECAAAGWLTVGAGRRTGAGGLCTPSVTGSGANARVDDWQARLKVAASNSGDARLGILAELSNGCVSAVGPGAALAAAKPDGSLQDYRTSDSFASNGYRLTCPLTLVDAGSRSDQVITALAGRKDVTVLVTGIGPDPGSHNQNLQLIYRLGTTLPGMMTSDTTRRHGIVTLIDLTRTLIDFSRGSAALPASAPVDGTLFQVDQQPVSTKIISDHLTMISNLSAVAPIGYAAGAAIGVLMAALLTVFVATRRWRGVAIMVAGLTTLTASLMLTGSFPWAAQSHPAVALVITLCCWAVILPALALGLSRWLKIPIPIAAAGITMATFTVDAALGGVMQPGSLLNSRPVVGGRWYGFGNTTFGCYAAATLVVAGYLAHRFARTGRAKNIRAHQWMPVIAVLIIGGLAVACEGWPSMGADFGGVISLTPAVLFLALAVSGFKITWQRLAVIAVVAVVVVGIVSVLDWARGAGHRSHLGDFVQRVISGDAWPIIIRKAEASGATLIAPLGIAGVIIGVIIWVVIFRRLRHAITADLWSSYQVTAIAVLVTAIIGTLLNDAGISVFLTLTGPFAATTAGMLYYRLRPYGWPAVLRGSDFADQPTPAVGLLPEIDRKHASRSGNPALRAKSRRR